MSVIWSKSTTDGWGAQRLDGALYDLTTDSVRRAEEASGAAASGGAARLVRADGGSRAWALIAPANSDARVNGRAAHGGLCVLADRDEIRSGAAVRYFSTETLAEVVPFPGAVRPVYCARCRQLLRVGTPAVSCPNCGMWHCQTDELPCWTYAETCAYCPQPTALDTGFTWTPEEG
jgi:hypothetical protein